MTSFRKLAAAALLVIPLLPACNADLKRRNEDLANSNHQLENELNEVKAQRDDARSRETTLKQQVASAEESKRLAVEQASAAKTAAPNAVAAPAEKRAKGASDEALVRKLSSTLASTKAKVESKNGRACVVLPLGDAFGSGSAELTPQGKRLVREVGKVLAKDLPSDAKLLVAGHSDSDPPKKMKSRFADNRALSFARAQAVTSKRCAPCGLASSSCFPRASRRYSSDRRSFLNCSRSLARGSASSSGTKETPASATTSATPTKGLPSIAVANRSAPRSRSLPCSAARRWRASRGPIRSTRTRSRGRCCAPYCAGSRSVETSCSTHSWG